ncbi:MAG: transglutaminase domain-containing protein [Planctomycetes bacterium]|nr:transglutaminase domain-containing protein [Planctomycetota bacterium]
MTKPRLPAPLPALWASVALLAALTTLTLSLHRAAAQDAPAPGAPPADAATAVTEERRFVIQVRGVEAGYGYYQVSLGKDGETRIEGESLLKLLISGREVVVRSKRLTVLGPGERLPREYRTTLSRGGETSEYVCRREGESMVEEARVRGTPTRQVFPLKSAIGLVDYNAPEHLEGFLRGRLESGRPFAVGAIIPDMLAVLPVSGRVFGGEELKTEDGVARVRRVELLALGMLFRGWLDDAGRLVRFEVPSQSFVALRTTRSLRELDLQAADLVRSFSVPLRLGDGVTAPGERARDPRTVREARFHVHVRVGENKIDSDVLTNAHQRFEPAALPAEAGWMEGTLTVGGAALAAPAAAPDLAPFLAPEPAIESDAPELRDRAAALIPEGTAPAEAGRLAADWVHGTVRYETQLVSALAAHQGKVGDCLTMARLTVALLRARGVPARVIGGLALGAGRRFGQHHWMEFYGGPRSGWVQLDPTYGQSAGVDAFHLDLWREGTFDGSADNWIELLGWEPAAD